MIPFFLTSHTRFTVAGGALISVLAIFGCGRSKPEAKVVPPKPPPVAKNKTTNPLLVTIAGQALDEQGHPLAGATLFLAAGNPLTSFGEATSDSAGRFQFRTVELPPLTMKGNDISARFEVFGTAPGKAYAWTGTRIFRPQLGRGPVASEVAATENVELAFRAPTRVWGQVLDEDGKPIQYARLRVSARLPTGTEKRFSPSEAQRLAYDLMPGAIDTISNADGRFEFRSAPPDAPLSISVTHNDFFWQAADISTSGEPGAKTKSLPVEFVLKETRRVIVKVQSADTGELVTGMPVYAYAGKFSSASTTGGRTDENGTVTLRLPLGRYYVRARPDREIESVASVEVTVEKSPAEQTVQLQIQPACQVVLKAVDVATGETLRNVPYWMSDDGGGSFTIITSPATTDGEIVLKEVPGKRWYGIGARQAISNVFGEIVIPILDGYEAVEPKEVTAGREVELIAGKTATVEFKLRRAK